jgi:Flp pilus assembly pilin Flp
VFWVRCLVRLAKDQRGQDLIEYGLLLGAFAAVGVAVFPGIVMTMRSAFLDWNTDVNGEWIPDDPL